MAKSEPARPTPFERFEEAARSLFRVSRKDVDKAELRAKKEREARVSDKAPREK